MDSNSDDEREPLFGEIRDSPAREESRVIRIPSFFDYGREARKEESMATNDRDLVSQQQKGDSSQKTEEDEIQCRTPFRNITNGKETVVVHPSGKQFEPLVPAPRSATKNLDKVVTIKSENFNLKSDSDKGAVQMLISSHQSKKRRIDSTTAQLANNKVASGTFVKQNIQEQSIDEIDLPDVNNQLAAVEYIKDLYAFYTQQQHVCRPIDYMEKQIELNHHARAVAIGWMIKVHHKCVLWPETLYLAVSIVDRYLSEEIITKPQLQLVVICGLLIASKYEENKALKINDFRHLTRNKYAKEVIICMEKIILNRLDWYLTIPTAYMFLVRFVKAAKADKELENMIYYFGELGLLEYKITLYCPCMVAAAAVYAARCTLGKFPLWTDTLRRHTSYTECEIQECAKILAKAYLVARDSVHKLRVVYTKYSLKEFWGVARYPAAMTLLEEPKPSVPAAS